jgi:hypothetical protein
MICQRDSYGKLVDGAHCSNEAYQNLTKNVEPYIMSGEGKDDDYFEPIDLAI